MLRNLIQEKEKTRNLMADLWKKKESGKQWTKEEREKYDKHNEKLKSLNDDIKLRAEYQENFEQALPKEDKKFLENKKKTSVFNLIKREAYEVTGDSRLKIDNGPIKEVLQERRRNMDSSFVKAGESPVPLNDFRLEGPKKERATLSTGSGSGADLVEESIYPEIVDNLYAMAWAGRLGADFVENWRGDFVLPSEDTEPASGFIAETADYPESSIDYKDAFTLKPKKVGALQPFSLQSFMQDETRQLQNSINSQLMKEWAKKVDTEFLLGDGTSNKPKGIAEFTGVLTQDVSTETNDGMALTFDDIKDAESLLENANQTEKGVWLINSKTAGHARKTLRNSVAGSLYIMNGNRFGDMKYVMTNIVPSDKVKGTSSATLSFAYLVVPKSVVVVHWAMPSISIDRSLGFKSDVIWTKISGYCNIGLKRPKDLVILQNIKTASS